MAAEITCSKCGHRVTVIDGQRIICPNCKETEAVKALFTAPSRTEEAIPVVDSDSRPQLIFICPFCSETYPVSEDLAGKKINCRNCYEASRAPGKEKKSKSREPDLPPVLPADAREPWYYGFLEQFANVGMVVGGLACLAGFLVAVSFAQGAKDILGPLSIALAFVVAFFILVGGMGLLRVVVDIARASSRHETTSRTDETSQ